MAKILKSLIPYKGPKTENLIEFIKLGLQQHSDRTILIDSRSRRSWTGREIEKAILGVSHFLLNSCNFKKGDVCTVYGAPNDSSVLFILGVISAGGVSNFCTDKYRTREVLDTSRVNNAKFLISNRRLLESAKEDLAQIDRDITVISCDEVCDGFKNGCKVFEVTKSTDSLLTFDDLIQRLAIDVEKDFAVVQFSSGTTGKPKPIPRTHKNLCHLVASVDHPEMMDLKPGEVIAGSLPITHRPGLWALLACINGGSTFVLWEDLSDVAGALKVVEEYGVTVFSSSLPFLSMLGNTGIQIKDKYNLTKLQHIITSGAKIVNSSLPESIVEAFNLKSLRQCFGMTESGWVFIIEKSLAKDNYLSVGHVVPGMEAIVINPQTHEKQEVNVRGELALKSPQIFPGYLTDKPGVFNRSDFIEGGWFRTGDECFYNETELFFIEGRYKELLIFENSGRYFPNEIEAVINEHPGIETSCVVKTGEFKGTHTYDIARAFVTLKHGCKVCEKEVLDFVASRSYEITLAGGVRILEQFPRLQNGKINKQALKEYD